MRWVNGTASFVASGGIWRGNWQRIWGIGVSGTGCRLSWQFASNQARSLREERPESGQRAGRTVADRGLREVIAADTHLSDIDGEKGTLSYVGYEIEDLAARSSFEEVVHLLHHLELPTAAQLDELASFLAAERDLHPFQVQLMGTLAEQTSPMSMLRTSVSAASAFDPDGWDESPDAQARKALRLIAKTASLLTTYHRLRTGWTSWRRTPPWGMPRTSCGCSTERSRTPTTSACSTPPSSCMPTTR